MLFTHIHWLDILPVFIILAGFIIGLGAVTVIDIHGFLGRKSEYWTLATTRTHKVTKPLIWIGIFLIILGGLFFYKNHPMQGIIWIHIISIIVLILNGLFLSFYVSPYLINKEKENKAAELLPQHLQSKITLSFIISFIGWWGNLFLFLVFLLQ
ncbi:MAG: hypothetical protein ACPGTS_02400 [Minisyncoccia bacterium]